MRAFVDKHLCIGCGLYPEICPQVFAIGDDEKAYVKEQADCEEGCCREAADSCPVGAISVE